MHNIKVKIACLINYPTLHLAPTYMFYFKVDVVIIINLITKYILISNVKLSSLKYLYIILNILMM